MHGFLDKPAFRRWLARNIEVVGLADPASIQAGEKKMNDIINESVVAASGVEVGGGQTPAGKKGRPKKKA